MIAQGSPDIETHPILQVVILIRKLPKVILMPKLSELLSAQNVSRKMNKMLRFFFLKRILKSYRREKTCLQTISRLSFDKCYLFVVIQSLISCYLLLLVHQESQILLCHGIFPATDMFIVKLFISISFIRSLHRLCLESQWFLLSISASVAFSKKCS